MIKPLNNKKYSMDKALQKKLELAKVFIRQDTDYVYVVDGEVGSGKSVFVQILAHFCSNGFFSLEDVVFSPEEFKRRVRTNQRFRAVVWDECFRGISGDRSRTKNNFLIRKLLKECRRKNLFIFLVTPNVWDIDKKVIRDRITGVFHIHTKKSIDKKVIENSKLLRGFWRYYKKRTIIKYMENDKNKDQHPNFSDAWGEWSRIYYELIGNKWIKAKPYIEPPFKHYYIVGAKEYLKKKDAAFNTDDDDTKKHIPKKQEIAAVNLILYLKNDLNYPMKKIAEICNVNRHTPGQWIRDATGGRSMAVAGGNCQQLNTNLVFKTKIQNLEVKEV